MNIFSFVKTVYDQFTREKLTNKGICSMKQIHESSVVMVFNLKRKFLNYRVYCKSFEI